MVCYLYVQAVDIWGVGCIFAELITHEAFFQVQIVLLIDD